MKQLLVLSGKGGTGKTTVAAAMIRLSGARAYADCDVDAPNLHLVMRPEGESIQDDFNGMKQAYINPEQCISCGICLENCRFDAIVHGPVHRVDAFGCEGCGVCERLCPQKAIEMVVSKAGDLILHKGHEVFSTARLKMGKGTSGMLVTEVKRRLKNHAPSTDVAILDGSPGIGCPVIASISGVDMVLMVAEPSLSGLSDLERVVATARGFGTQVVVCINKYDTNTELTRRIVDYCHQQGIPHVGNIPYDSAVLKAVNAGKSAVDMECAAADAIRAIHSEVMVKLASQSAGMHVVQLD